MPRKKKQPDPEPAVILKTRAEVARHFGVAERTVAGWIRELGFPGTPAKPGEGATGNFPVAAIEEWLKTRGGARGTGPGFAARERLALAKAEREELDLGKERGTLIDAEAVERFFVRTCAGAAAILLQMGDRAAAKLPRQVSVRVGKKTQRVQLPDQVVDAVIDVVQETGREVASAIAELIEGDQDESVPVDETG